MIATKGTDWQVVHELQREDSRWTGMWGIIILVAQAQMEAPQGTGNGGAPYCQREFLPESQRMSECLKDQNRESSDIFWDALIVINRITFKYYRITENGITELKRL